jgi:CheY-like chemotaxis protein
MAETNTTPPLGLLLSDDLIFISRIVATAKAQGLNLKSARSAANLVALARQQRPGCVIVDLANPGLILPELLRELAEVCEPLPRLVAYGSHVDTDTLRAARAAGCDPVWPRSKFVEELATALPEWFQQLPR